MKSIYNRVAELVNEKKSSVSDSELFRSKEYLNFINKKGRNIIMGTFNNLLKEGFQVLTSEENEILRTINFEVIYDTSPKAPTAYCASDGINRGDYILINAGNKSLIGSLPTREEKHWAILGLLYHEIGHLLFTDFPTMNAWRNQILNGTFFPCDPKRLSTTVSGVNLNTKFKQDVNFRSILATAAQKINNALEDGYIEREIRLMMPGAGKTALATINSNMFEQQNTLEEMMAQEEKSEFFALLSQLLRYAKCGEVNLGNYDGPLMDDVFEIMNIVDDNGYSRDPMLRVQATNELLCVLFPYLENEIEKMEKENNSQKSSQKGKNKSSSGSNSDGQASSGGSSSSSNSGNSSGSNASGSVSQNVANSLNKAIDNCSKQNGASGSSDTAKSGSIIKKVSGEKAKQEKNGAANSGQNDDANSDSSNNNSASMEKQAASKEVDNVINQLAKNAATLQAEKERVEELTQEANDEDYSDLEVSSVGTVNIIRDAQVTDSAVKSYETIMQTLAPISKDLQRGIKKILKERRQGGVQKNLYFGRRLEVSSIIHDDYKYFSKRKLPTESPKLGVGLLVDESGSTSGKLITAARNTALIIEDFCRGLDIPHIINGYTCGGYVDDATILSYSEPNEIDDSNKYRIMGMTARGGTPTKSALAYMVKRMRKLDADFHLLIVISDGCSGDNYNNEILKIIKNAKRSDTHIISAGIGKDRKSVEKEFGEDNFVDISDLEQMPELLIGIIKKELRL